MLKQQEIFINLLKDFVNERESVIDQTQVDFNLLYTYAHEQNLVGLIYNQIKKYTPNDYKPQFEATTAANLVATINRNALVKSIKQEFKNENIPFVFVKGAELLNIYSKPHLRTMGDSDILVKKEDKEKVDNIFQNKLGFDKTTDGFEWVYYKNKLEFEIHDSLAYEKDKIGEPEALNEFWDHVYKDEESFYHLEDYFHLVYLLFHSAKHLNTEGVGFRQFMDIAILCNKKEIDYIKTKELIKRIKLEKFSEVVFYLINKWFGINTPLNTSVISDEFFEEVVEKIFKGGVLGHNDSENKTSELGTFNTNKKTNIFTRIAFLLSKLFPSWQTIKSVAYLDWIKGRDYLVPFAYVYRWFYVLFNSKIRKTFVKKITASNKDVEKRKKTLNNWGL